MIFLNEQSYETLLDTNNPQPRTLTTEQSVFIESFGLPQTANYVYASEESNIPLNVFIFFFFTFPAKQFHMTTQSLRLLR